MPSPIGSPSPSVRVDGRDSPAIAASLISLAVEETVDGLARCELALSNWGERNGQAGYLWFDRDELDLGSLLTVTLGADPRRGEVFSGTVTGLQASFEAAAAPRVVVVAHDRLLRLQLTRRSRTFEHATDAEAIASVAADHGLTVELELQADGPTHRQIAQANASDLAFIRTRARYLDADVRLRGSKLEVTARTARPALETGWTLGTDLLDVEVTADLASQRTAVYVSGHDRQTRSPIDAQAGATAIAGELAGEQQSGPDAVAEVFGQHAERLVHLAPDDADIAQVLADERLRSTARRFVTATAVIEGDARARAGVRGTFEGLGPLFSGSYGIVGVRHTFDGGAGFRSTLHLERAGLGGPP
jgi:uncharacterized protein